MITIRPSAARGSANYGWLDTKHTFSFANYFDRNFMGFASLRVINEDKILPGKGFGTHGHSDMEIITYVLTGNLKHQDSIGNGSIISAGDVQRMSAGTGILHSEYNASVTEPVHLLQIWILPDTKGIQPSYEQKHFAPEDKQGKLRLVASPDGRDGSVTIHQDANLYIAALSNGETVNHAIAEARVVWIQVAKGAIKLNGETLMAGDGAAIKRESAISITGIADDTEVLLFDLV